VRLSGKNKGVRTLFERPKRVLTPLFRSAKNTPECPPFPSLFPPALRATNSPQRGRRIVVTGGAKSADRRTERNQWKVHIEPPSPLRSEIRKRELASTGSASADYAPPRSTCATGLGPFGGRSRRIDGFWGGRGGLGGRLSELLLPEPVTWGMIDS
jgi:hypothetical protein